MSWNVVVQLGISGLVVAAGYKIAMVLIARWAEGDKDRTKVIGDGFRTIAEGNQTVIQTMNEHQLVEIGIFNTNTTALARLDEKLNVALELTPVHGIRIEASTRHEPKAVVDPGFGSGVVERRRPPR